MTTTDTHGDGLDRKAKLLAALDGGDKVTILDMFDRLSARAASDTAGPSDHAGLVERLEDLIPNTLMFDNAGYYDTPLTFAVREAIAALSRAPEAWLGEGDGFKSFTRQKAHAERWRKGGIKVTALYATPPAPQPALALEAVEERRLSDVFRKRASEPDSGIVKTIEEPVGVVEQHGGIRWFNPPIPLGTKLYVTPPTPQPALALIEELERALRPFERIADIADMDEGASPSASVIVNVARCRDARTAIASAKRFKEGA